MSDETHGAALEGILRDLEAAGITVGSGGEAPLKTAPRDYPKDHPRIALLRWKGATASQDFGKPAWLRTAEAPAHAQRSGAQLRRSTTGSTRALAAPWSRRRNGRAAGRR